MNRQRDYCNVVLVIFRRMQKLLNFQTCHNVRIQVINFNTEHMGNKTAFGYNIFVHGQYSARQKNNVIMRFVIILNLKENSKAQMTEF